ncbi:MAG: AAA family ATPase, partial [Spirochaetia bacterium]|nr:AAA family ATPase [Spirochaetia bacterium]
MNKDEKNFVRAGVFNEIQSDELQFIPDLSSVSLDNKNGKEEFAGQKRAVSALESGIYVGYNIYVSGISGSEDIRALQNWLKEKASSEKTPEDFVYVNNFKNPDEPHAIKLNNGMGKVFQKKMNDLIRTLKRELPESFRKEAFDKEKLSLKDKYSKRSEKLSKTYDALAKEKGFIIQSAPDGNIFFIPLVNDKPMENPEEFAKLPEEERESISRKQEELGRELEKLLVSQKEILKELETDIRAVERRFAENVLNPLINDIKKAIESDFVDRYLDELKEHILDHIDKFKDQTHFKKDSGDEMFEYDVNVAVDNSNTKGAPVILESSPGYINLFGNIERVVDRNGRVVTNFTRIKSGSLLRSHGGYLIINLADALSEAAVWKTLKRTLKNKRIEIETYEPFALFSTTGLKPEGISIDTTVIVYGSSYLYNLLYMLDEEFPNVFKARADFGHTMENKKENISAYIQWINNKIDEMKYPLFEKSGYEKMIAYGARIAENREKIPASREIISDLVKESAYIAVKNQSRTIDGSHVAEAIRLRKFQNNRIEEELTYMTEKGVLLIEIEGKKIGQINALSVLNAGGYEFGRPTRITATVGMGSSGIINIEREAKMSGKIHDKGVLILSGYLRSLFGQKFPLNLSAGITFEQSYSGVEGDSASSTELYALLSALSQIPLRQDLAVTGSVNQYGDIQAIGGVNEKIEGFYRVCKMKGLTGDQGV